MDLIRCRHCNAVFPDSMTGCPRCGRDPAPRSKWTMLFWLAGAVGVAVAVLLMVSGR